jgi:glyoxylase-like metal-dependent hydrolase (beta-lactamase superfamily II)
LVANARPGTVTLAVERIGDVTRWRMSSTAARAVGYDVSAYVYRGVMIDTGFHHARRALGAALSAAAIRGVVVTHWHEDHAGNAPLLASRGMPMLVRHDTEAMLRRRPSIQLYRHLIWGRPPALEGEVARFECDELECVHTPGHSEDHQVVWFPETRTLFSGDLWLGVRSRILNAAEDPYVLIESLRRAAALGPERMFDAHRGAVTKPVDALLARADWLSETLDEIARRIAADRSDRVIVKELLGGEEPAAFVSFGEYSRRNLVRAVRRRLRSD